MTSFDREAMLWSAFLLVAFLLILYGINFFKWRRK